MENERFDRERVIQAAQYMIKTKMTIREVAEEFKVSKSTIHLDLTQRLEKVDKNLYNQVQEVLEQHKSERSIKGGSSTKERWENIKPIE